MKPMKKTVVSLILSTICCMAAHAGFSREEFIKALEASRLSGWQEVNDFFREHRIEQLISDWQAQYGDVDFSEENLRNAMSYLHPKTEEHLQEVTEGLLPESYQTHHTYWARVFFQPSFLKQYTPGKPGNYYVDPNGKLPGYLQYTFSNGQVDVTIIENGDVMMVHLDNQDFDPDRGFSSEEFLHALSSTFQLSFEDIIVMRTLRPSPGIPKEGFLFSSPNAGQFHVSRNWKSHLFGFVGAKGLHVLVFKIQPDPSQVQFRYDFRWLDRMIRYQQTKNLEGSSGRDIRHRTYSPNQTPSP